MIHRYHHLRKKERRQFIMTNDVRIVITNDQKQYYDSHFPTTIMLTVFFVVGFIGNSLILTVYWKLSERTKTEFLIFSIAIFDFMTVTVFLPTYLIYLTFWFEIKTVSFCKIVYASGNVCIIPTIFLLFTVTLVRYCRFCPHYPFLAIIEPHIEIVCVLSGMIGIGYAVLDACHVEITTDKHCGIDIDKYRFWIQIIYYSKYAICPCMMIVLIVLNVKIIMNKHQNEVTSSIHDQSSPTSVLDMEDMDTDGDQPLENEEETNQGYASQFETVAESFVNRSKSILSNIMHMTRKSSKSSGETDDSGSKAESSVAGSYAKSNKVRSSRVGSHDKGNKDWSSRAGSFGKGNKAGSSKAGSSPNKGESSRATSFGSDFTSKNTLSSPSNAVGSGVTTEAASSVKDNDEKKTVDFPLNMTETRSSNTIGNNQTISTKKKEKDNKGSKSSESSELFFISLSRTTAMISIVCTAYVLSFLPITIITFLKKIEFNNFSDEDKTFWIIPLGHMFFLGCAVNPIIYTLVDQKFRSGCSEVLRLW